MAKKETEKRYIGSKVSRGVQNGALTPSGEQADANDSLALAITSSAADIIEQIKKNTEVTSSLITAVQSLAMPDVNSALKDFTDSIEDKMVAMLGSMYGFRGANSKIKSGQYLGMLKKIDPKSTQYSGLYNAVTSIENMLASLKPAAPSTSSQLESIALGISAQLNEIKEKLLIAQNSAADANISLQMPEGLLERLDSLKESVISNNSANNIKRVSSEIAELRSDIMSVSVIDYRAHLDSISKQMAELSAKVEAVKSQGVDLSEVMSRIDSVNASISSINNAGQAAPVVEVGSTDVTGIISKLSDISSQVKQLISYEQIANETSNAMHETVSKLDNSIIKIVDHLNIPQPVSADAPQIISTTNSAAVNTTTNADFTEVLKHLSQIENAVASIHIPDFSISQADMSSLTELLKSIASNINTVTEAVKSPTASGQAPQPAVQAVTVPSVDLSGVISQLQAVEQAVNSVSLPSAELSPVIAAVASLQQSVEKGVTLDEFRAGIEAASEAVKSVKPSAEVSVGAADLSSIESLLQDAVSLMQQSVSKAASELPTASGQAPQPAVQAVTVPSVDLSGVISQLQAVEQAVNSVSLPSTELSPVIAAVASLQQSVEKGVTLDEFISTTNDIIQAVNEISSPINSNELEKITMSLYAVENLLRESVAKQIEVIIPKPDVNIPAFDFSSILDPLSNIEKAIKEIEVPNTDLASVNDSIAALREAAAMGITVDDFLSATDEILQAISKAKPVESSKTIESINLAVYAIEDMMRSGLEFAKNAKTEATTSETIASPSIDLSNVLAQLSAIEDAVKNAKASYPAIDLSFIHDDLSNIINLINSVDKLQSVSYEMANANVSLGQIISLLQGASASANVRNDATGASYTIDINATGLDAAALSSLLELMKLQAADDIDISGLVDSIKQFEEISKIPAVDYHSVESILAMSELIGKIDSTNLQQAVNGIAAVDFSTMVSQVNSLGDLDDDVSYDGVSRVIRGYLDVVLLVNSMLNDKKNKIDVAKLFAQDGPFGSLQAATNEIKEFISNIQSVKVSNQDINHTQNIGKLIESVVALGGIDKVKTGTLSGNLRQLIYLTEKPMKFFTAVGLSDRGLLWTLIHNVAEASKTASSEEKSVEGIAEFISKIIKLQDKFDRKQLKEFSKKLVVLNEVLTGECSVNTALTAIDEISEKFSTSNKDNAKAVKNMKKLLGATGALDTAIDFSSIISLGIKLAALDVVLATLPLTWKLISSAADQAQGIAEKAQMIHAVLAQFDSEATDKMKALNDFAKAMGVVNVSLSIAAAAAPLAWVGLWTMNAEMKLISSIVDKVNNTELTKDTTSKANGIALLIAACAGVMMLAAVAGAYVATHWADMLLFSVNLGIFMLLTIGALNLATRGMAKAKDNAEQFAKLLVICGSIMLIGGAIMTFYPKLIIGSLLFAVSLGAFILSVVGAFALATKIDMGNIHGKMDDMMIVVGAAAGLMLIGAALFEIPGMLVSAIGFTVLLAAFIGGISYAYAYSSQAISDAAGTAEEFAKLIAISAATLLAGGGLLYAFPWMTLTTFAFGVILAAFIAGTTFAYNTWGDGISESLKYAEKFALLIAVSAAALLAGGYMLQANPWIAAGVIGFGILLTAFIGGVAFVYKTFAEGISDSIKNAEKFAVLVALSGAILLMGGSLLTDRPSLALGVLGFGVLLAAFIVAIAGAYKLASMMMGDSLKVADEFYLLVGASALILIIGGAFMLIPGMWQAALQFTLNLALFIALIGAAYRIISAKDIKKIMPAAVGLGVLVAVSAATILLGGMMFLHNEGLALASLKFAAISILFVGAMSALTYALGKVPFKDILTGLLALGGITLIIYGLTEAFVKIADISNTTDFGKMLDTLELMGIAVVGTLTLVGILAGVIGATGGIGAAAIAAAEVMLAGVVWIIDLTAGAIEHIAAAAHAVDNMPDFDANEISSKLGSMADIAWSLAPMANPFLIPMLLAARQNTHSLSVCMSEVAKGVRELSDLKIPVYNDNGKQVGYRTLDEHDFDTAANNIASIITTIGGAIIEVYNENPDIFSAGTMGDLLGMDTPFSRVSKSCATMGTMIAKIAEGVKEYADLRIATYDENGNKTGTRPLNDKDFTNAAENIKKIITVLGKAVIDTYNLPGAKEMFKWKLIGDNPFAMVVKSCSSMGSMISTIAKSVRDYANLRIDTYDENGNKTGTREMTGDDFTNAATSVKTILTTLGDAVIQVYNARPELFTDSSMWHTDADKTPFGMVVKAMTGTGQLISEGAQAVRDVLSMDVDWSEESQNSIASKVAFVLGILANAIYSLAVDESGNSNPAFTDSSLWHNSPEDTPVGMVIGSLKGSSELIKEGMAIVKEVAAMEDIDEAVVRARTKLAIATLAGEIVKLATDPATKGAFEDDSWFSNSAEDTPVGMVKAALKGSSDLINEGIAIIDKISKLNVDDTKIGRIVSNIISAVPNGLLNATLFNPDAAKREWWNDDPADDIADTIECLKLMVKSVTSVVKEYDALAQLVAGGANISELSASISTMMTSIPNAIRAAQARLVEKAVAKDITDAFKEYSKTMKIVLDIYKSTWSTFNRIGAVDDETKVDMIGKGMTRMAAYMISSMRVVTSVGLDVLEQEVAGFTDSMQKYQEGITNLCQAFAMMPEETTSYDNLEDAIKKINFEIAQTPNLEQFTEESRVLKSYVRTINSLNSGKVDRLTNLANALTNMSTRLGSLDNLTDVLANKVSAVLSTLADRIDDSAKVITTADKMQKDRHEKITDALKTLKALMDKPLNVSVTHMQETQDGNELNPGTANGDTGSSAGTGGSTGSSGGSAGSSSSPSASYPATPAGVRRDARSAVDSQMSPSQPAQQPARNQSSQGGGVSERRAREIAADEAAKAIENYRNSSNSRAGGGARTGANS